jgi:hypothetical protein
LQLLGELEKKCPNIAIIKNLKNLTLKAEVKVLTITSQETDVEIQ